VETEQCRRWTTKWVSPFAEVEAMLALSTIEVQWSCATD
jgi:hypothetical protein